VAIVMTEETRSAITRRTLTLDTFIFLFILQMNFLSVCKLHIQSCGDVNQHRSLEIGKVV